MVNGSAGNHQMLCLPHLWPGLLAGALVLLTPVLAPGQDKYARRDYSTPGLILDTGARRGACDVLRFTLDGNYLLAAGDDKVVNNWKFIGGKLAPSDLPNLRWAIYKEHRGQIYALDLDKTGQFAVIGGYGVSAGLSAVVIDRHTGKIKHALPKNSGVSGSIWAAAFSPSGKQAALGLHDGSIWLWAFPPSKTWTLRNVGKHDPANDVGAKDKGFNFVKFVQFVDANTLLSVAESGQAIVWDLNQNKRTHTFDFGGPVQQVAINADHTWLAASVVSPNGSRVEFRSFPEGKARVPISLPKEHFPHGLAFDAKSARLAVGLRVIDGSADFLKETSFPVRVYDVTTSPAKMLQGFALTHRPYCLAFHPTANYLAAAGGTNFEVTLWDLSKTAPKLVSSIPEPGQAIGKTIWSVAISPTGDLLGFQDQRDPNPKGVNWLGLGSPRVFDLKKMEWATKPCPPFQPLESTGGWRVLTSLGGQKDIYTWYVESPGKKVYTLPLPPAGNVGEPSCYTFLPAKGNQPVRLLVGHYFGVSMFALNNQSGPKLIRMFQGHEAQVTALAVTPDQKRLITASADQTLAGWSLGTGPSGNSFGALLAVEGGKLVVKDVDPGSPAWETGLDKGDQIVTIFVKDKFVYNHEPYVEKDLNNKTIDAIGTAEIGQGALQNAAPGVRITFYWKRPGSKTRLYQLTSMLERPLWRFFPAGERDWVLWRWRDYYYDTSAKGDSYIGWQRSFEDLGQTPVFYKAEQLRQHFHRPDMIAQMLRDWSASPHNVAFATFEPPEVQLPGPAVRLVKGKDLTVELIAATRNKLVESQNLSKVTLWINDYQFAHFEREGDEPVLTDYAFQKLVTIPASKLRSGKNVLTLQCYNHAGSRGETSIQAILDQPRPTPSLFGLFVGVGKYNKAVVAEKLIGAKLKLFAPSNLNADEDANILAETWKAQEGKMYGKVFIAPPLNNALATRGNILKALDGLVQKAKSGAMRPDDVLVLHLAGHGVRADEFDLPPPQLKILGDYLFVCADFHHKNIGQTSVGFEEIYERLIQLPCHKLLLLDTCRSGALQKGMDSKSNPIRLLTKDGIGPVILAACEEKQSALEHPNLDFGFAFGLFTIALRKTVGEKEEFARADTDKNQKLTGKEIAAHIKKLVPQYVDQLRKDGVQGLENQNPVVFLPALEENLELAQK